MAGPLTGTRIIEVAGIGPGPFCAMMLADMGADVIRVDRAASVTPGGSGPVDVLSRNRRSIAIDLKNPAGVETLLGLVEKADALIEGFRPGVMERLGIGPDVCLKRNPRLVFGRMTGWGQEGPYSQAAGHDINYISLAGCLAHLGHQGEAPVPPLNLIGDFGGGGMFLAYGVVCGVLEARSSGKGQVVDCAMVDGAAMLMAMFHGMAAMGRFSEERGTNLLDTGSHFYNTYECADGKYISVGSIEPQFYAELLQRAGLKDDPEFQTQMDQSKWPHLRERLAALFKSKTQAEWCELMEATDVCFAPILPISEAVKHPHNVHRKSFVEVDGVTQPAPAPRFSRTTVEVRRPGAHPGEHSAEILGEWLGHDTAQIARLTSGGAVAQG
ncbi:MAG: CaiB/BaiF CoA transferase family protein [Dehalococcoidia bacterium]